jgi:thiol peroxidase
MAATKFKGAPVNTVGDLPQPGADAPNCTLVKTDLSELTFAELSGQKVVLNIFPALIRRCVLLLCVVLTS